MDRKRTDSETAGPAGVVSLPVIDLIPVVRSARLALHHYPDPCGMRKPILTCPMRASFEVRAARANRILWAGLSVLTLGHTVIDH